MKTMNATLKIAGDRRSAQITSNHDGSIFFEGGEEQAIRMSFCVPRFVGGDVYAVLQGELTKRDRLMVLTIEDGAGMDNHLEIEFADNKVTKVSVIWTMNYKKDYPRLTRLIGVLVNPDFTEEELKSLVDGEIKDFPDLASEIIRSFDAPDFSWMEILNHPKFGEVFDAETEEEAREFAAEMFLKQALS